MAVTRHVAARLLAVLASGCVEEPEPDWLSQGEWLDVGGRGSQRGRRRR